MVVDWIESTLIFLGFDPNRRVVNTCKGQKIFRTGLYQEIWTENKQCVGPSATREDEEHGEEAGLGTGSSCGAITFSKGRCWRPSSSLQSTSTDMYIAFVGFTTSGCPAARSTAATSHRRGGSAEGRRMAILLLTRGSGAVFLTQKIPFSREHLAAY